MIYSRVRLEKLLNYLLVFLLPTQLALHFWPPFAFVFGTRVDYLSPSIYLTDALFVIVFLFWILKNYRKFLSFLHKHRVYLFPLVILAVLNTIFSISIYASVFKWLKLIELVLFCYYIWVRDDIFKPKTILTTLFYSLVFFSVIGIVQFILGRTTGGAFYLLGERNFSLSTPGIALAQLMGVKFMRAYSTFSHPNSLAGYLGVGLLVVFFSFSVKELLGKGLGLLIIFLAFVLTFSTSAFLGVAVCLIMLLLWRKRVFTTKNVGFISAGFLITSLALPFISQIYFNSNLHFTQNIVQRFELSLGAGRMISKNFIFGEGLNTFVIGESKITQLGFNLWILQPVHNIFLLVFSEMGIFGLLFFYWLIVKSFKKSFLSGSSALFLSLVFILTTGLFDHYWFTLQQNMFLFAFILGNSFRARS